MIDNTDLKPNTPPVKAGYDEIYPFEEGIFLGSPYSGFYVEEFERQFKLFCRYLSALQQCPGGPEYDSEIDEITLVLDLLRDSMIKAISGYK